MYIHKNLYVHTYIHKHKHIHIQIIAHETPGGERERRCLDNQVRWAEIHEGRLGMGRPKSEGMTGVNGSKWYFTSDALPHLGLFFCLWG